MKRKKVFPWVMTTKGIMDTQLLIGGITWRHIRRRMDGVAWGHVNRLARGRWWTSIWLCFSLEALPFFLNLCPFLPSSHYVSPYYNFSQGTYFLLLSHFLFIVRINMRFRIDSIILHTYINMCIHVLITTSCFYYIKSC